MSAFDRMDARISASVDRLLASPGNAVWRPMAARQGGLYTRAPGGPEVDPTRPVKPLRAVITWKLDGMIPVEGGASSTGGGTVSNAQLLVDINEDQFTLGVKPRKGDRFDLPEEPDPGNRLVEVYRIGDDGGVRLLCWCNVVK